MRKIAMNKGKHTSLAGNMRQLFKFALVGICNNAISLAVYYMVIALNRDWYLVGNVLGFLISTLNAWIMNSRFVFHTEKRDAAAKRATFIRTYATYIISLGVSTALLYVFVEWFNIDERLAPIGCLMITVPFNFLMNKLWVYKKGNNDNDLLG